MTIEQVKECLSRSFVTIIANNRKFMCTKPDSDYGVDLTVNTFVPYTLPSGKTRITPKGTCLDVQLKATTVSGVTRTPTIIKFDLETKNYNDLVLRKQGGLNPLILILYILPDDDAHWVKVDPTELLLRREAYWYQPNTTALMTTNVATQRIDIPITNKLDINSFPYIFDLLGI